MITCYPDKNSLKEVLDSELSISTLKYICKKNGMFLLSNNKSDVINTAHLYYWGFDDINRFSTLMEDAKNYKKSFRLELDGALNQDNSSDCDIFSNFYTLLANYRNGVGVQNGITFDSFIIEDISGEKHLKASVEYKKKRKGRVKLMDEVTQRFSFDAFKSNDKIIVDVIFDDRSDVQKAKKIITDSISITDEFTVPIQISLLSLTTAERVELFDKFLSYRLNNWSVEVVRNIKVQKTDAPFDEEDEENEVVENNFLTGIESALFTGSGLRTNPIIIDAVNKGYFFPKATVMLTHRRESIKLLLDISFNTDELILELSIVSTYEVEDDRSYKHPIDVEEQKIALQYFHGVINQIYNEIKSNRQSEENK